MEVPGEVQGEFAQQLAGVPGDDADVQVVDQERDAGAGVGAADADVVQAAVVAQGDGAGPVDLLGLQGGTRTH